MRDPVAAKPGNVPEMAVSELAGALKRTVEDNFSFVRVRGEISGFKGVHASGHAYFSLKDASARLDAVIWKTTLGRLRIKPAEGFEVVASGRITTYPAKSSYQLVIDSLEPAGVGALMALIDARRRQLAAEGLFDKARKRALPFLPRTIGVVTSPSGAVIRDVLHRLSERFPVRVLVWPVRVQGEGAAEEIAQAIRGFSLSLGMGIPRPDVLIVARGGGSLEDLWAFNEEEVVRATASSEIPVVSAIGHETDWTLIDYAADMRAPTPTAAAELCTPVRRDLLLQVSALEMRSTGALNRTLKRTELQLRVFERAFLSKTEVITRRSDRLRAYADRLDIQLRRRNDQHHLKLSRFLEKLRRFQPRVRLAKEVERERSATLRLQACIRTQFQMRTRQIDSATQRLTRLLVATSALRTRRNTELQQKWVVVRYAVRQRLRDKLSLLQVKHAYARASTQRRVEERRGELIHFSAVLRSINHESILQRGFAIVFDEAGRVKASASEVREGSPAIKIRFRDGEVSASTAKATSTQATTRKSRSTKVTQMQDQLKLF